MALLDIVYCDQQDMERLFSIYGVREFSDHEGLGIEDTDVIDDCINQATEEIDAYALGRYANAGLAASTLVNRWATTLACYFLTLRRGNPAPASLEAEFNRIAHPDTGLLARVRTYNYDLPGVAMNGDLRPTASNLQIDRRHRHNKVRVTPSNSTDAPSTLRQNTKIEGPVVYE